MLVGFCVLASALAFGALKGCHALKPPSAALRARHILFLFNLPENAKLTKQQGLGWGDGQAGSSTPWGLLGGFYRNSCVRGWQWLGRAAKVP